MNNNKLLIFIITLVFLLSVNFAFAADENSTDLTVVEDVQDHELTDAVDEEMIAAEDNSGDVLREIQTINMDKVTKRYNGAIQ